MKKTLSSSEVCLLQSKHPDHSIGSEISMSTFTDATIFSDCRSDEDMYHNVFTRSDLYLGAKHVLEVKPTLCNYPLEFIVESMLCGLAIFSDIFMAMLERKHTFFNELVAVHASNLG